MNILVTGGAGYLGSILTELLLAEGYVVTVADSFEHGVPSLAHLCRHDNLTILRQDVRHAPDYSRFDCVLPLAAIVGAAACDVSLETSWSVNYDVIRRMCNRLSAKQIVVIPTTNSGYGVGGPSECTEESPLQPISVYGQTKVRAESIIMERSNSVSLRLATLFGWSSRMRRDLLVNDLTWRAVRDRSVVIFEGGHRRNFCHVRDAARAFVHVLRNWSAMRGQVYNVGDTAANMTKLQLCERIQDHAPQFRYLAADFAEDPDKRDYVVSNAKIEATGWAPTTTLDEGIEELIRGYAMLRREQYGNS